MLGERGVSVDHSTSDRWGQRYALVLEASGIMAVMMGRRDVHQGEGSLDVSVYCAVDKGGATIDFYLSPTRNGKAAKRFLGKALVG